MQRDKGIILGGFAVLLAVLFALLYFNVVTEDRDAPIEAAAPDTEEVAETPEEAPETPEPVEGSDDLEDTEAKPNVPAQEGEAPTELVIEDIVEGEGPEAEAGDAVVMDYVGVLYEDGTQFDASWDRGQTFDFTIGEDPVIQGWEEGIPGMKVGGRRMLTIPSDMAYGEAGSPPTIPADAALVFIVDLREIQ